MPTADTLPRRPAPIARDTLLSMNTRRSIAIVGAAILLGSCQPDAPGVPGGGPGLVLVDSATSIPASETHSIAIVTDTRACVINSYEKEVLCGDRNWTDAHTVGRVGAGPGEFRNPGSVLRGPAGSVGVLDARLRRLTVFDEIGTLSFTASIPFLLRPDASFDSIIAGSFVGGTLPGTNTPGTAYATISLPTGTVRSTVYIPHPAELGRATATTRGLSHGARSPAGELTFMTTAGRELVRYSEDGVLLHMTTPAAYTELPNSRDIAEFTDRMLFGRKPTAEEVRTYSREPKRYAIAGRSAIYDRTGRLWVLTLRDRDEVSWFDVYDRNGLLRSVAVRDRVQGFDIKDSILATVVERSRLDSDGIPVRSIDWYRITDE